MSARIALVVLCLAPLACERRPPPSPRVSPEARPDVPAPARAMTPPAPPPRLERPPTLRTPGGLEVAALRGRVDRLRVATDGARARLVAEVQGARRETLAVTVAPDGTITPTALSFGVRDVRIAAAPVLTAGAFGEVMFGGRRGASDAQDFAVANRFGLGAARSPVEQLGVEELVAAHTRDRWAAAVVAERLSCFERECEGTDRTTSGMLYHPRDGYTVLLVTPAGPGIRSLPGVAVPCDAPELGGSGEGEGEPTGNLVPADVGSPPERCRGVRPQRPTDVAVALRGETTVVVWRTSQGLWLRRVEGGVAQPGTPTPWIAGDVGAPALAVRGDQVVAVWAQRDAPRSPYSLRTATLDLAQPSQVVAPQVIVTGTASAFAPSLADVDGRWVLAWMEGDDRAATVRVGATWRALPEAAAHAVVVSTPGANARDPELAAHGPQAWIAWTEYPGGRRRDQGGGVVRASPLGAPGT
ncbi:MAG: hypothetical protein U0325_10970 [Polyangiales bacterium]